MIYEKITIAQSIIFLVVYYNLTLFDILKTTLKSISKQNLLKIYHVDQELSAFSLTDHDPPD